MNMPKQIRQIETKKKICYQMFLPAKSNCEYIKTKQNEIQNIVNKWIKYYSCA